MDTGPNKLPEDLCSVNFLDLGNVSLLNELEDISEPFNEPGAPTMAPHNIFAGKPCT